MKLEVKNLSSGYDNNLSLKNVSFALESGSVMCVIGHNGGGKSTLFKTILGFMDRKEGSVTLDGEDIKHWSSKKIAEYFSYIPQNHTPIFGYTVIDVVVMGRVGKMGFMGTPSKKDFEKGREALEYVGIIDLEDRKYTELSGGERKLVLIARAICQESKFMVMDEPTSDLDFVKSERIYEVIRKLSSYGYGIILSTHAPDYPFTKNDKLLILKKGSVVDFGNAEEVLTSENLEKAYGVPMDILEAVDRNGKKRRMCVVL